MLAPNDSIRFASAGSGHNQLSNRTITPKAITLPANAPALTNTRALGDLLYTRYVFAFQGAGLILLVAMIGAIVLTLRQRVGGRKQRITEQLARSRAEAVEVVKVPLGSGATGG